MEYNWKLSLDIEEVIEQKLELRSKNRSVITDDGIQKALKSHHHIDNYFLQFWSIDSDLD